MRRSGWVWTWGLLLLAMALPTACLIRWFDCEACGGTYRKHQAVPVPGLNMEPTGCPDCFDQGKISLLTRAWREPVDRRLATLIRMPPDVRTTALGTGVREVALRSLLTDAGRDPETFKESTFWVWTARFAASDDQELILILSKRFHPTPPQGEEQAWLFDRKGALLDAIGISGSKVSARPGLHALRDPGPFSERKDAVLGISVIDHSGERDTDISRVLNYAQDLSGVRTWQQDVGDVPPQQWIKGGRAIFKIAGGRFVRIPPVP